MSSAPLEYLKQIIKIKEDLNIINYNELSDIDDYLILVAFTHHSWKWSDDISKMLQEKFDLYNYEFIEYIGDRILKIINLRKIDELVTNLKIEKTNKLYHLLQAEIESNLIQSCISYLKFPICRNVIKPEYLKLNYKICSDNLEAIIGMFYYHLTNKKIDFPEIISIINEWYMNETGVLQLFNYIKNIIKKEYENFKTNYDDLKNLIAEEMIIFCINKNKRYDDEWKNMPPGNLSKKLLIERKIKNSQQRLAQRLAQRQEPKKKELEEHLGLNILDSIIERIDELKELENKEVLLDLYMKLEKTKNLMIKEPKQKTLIPKFEKLKKQIIDLEFIENYIESNDDWIPRVTMSELSRAVEMLAASPVILPQQSPRSSFSSPNPFALLEELDETQSEGGHVKYGGKIHKVYIGKRGGKYIKCKGKKVYL